MPSLPFPPTPLVINWLHQKVSCLWVAAWWKAKLASKGTHVWCKSAPGFTSINVHFSWYKGSHVWCFGWPAIRICTWLYLNKCTLLIIQMHKACKETHHGESKNVLFWRLHSCRCHIFSLIYILTQYLGHLFERNGYFVLSVKARTCLQGIVWHIVECLWNSFEFQYDFIFCTFVIACI